MARAIVLYPSPPIGHLISMVELGKLLLTHQPSLSVHILITSVPYDSGSTAPYIANVAATVPSIKFHHLPTVTLPHTRTIHHEELTFDVLRLSNPHVREELLSISKNYTVHGLVVDFFCCAALSVAKELNIPGYHFSSSGAGIVAVFLYFPTIHSTTTKSLKDLKTLLHIPGVPPIPSSDMPAPVLDRDDKSYEYFLDSSRSFPESAGIIVNTFETFEARAVETISEGLCVPNDRTPPIYCIGPLIASEGRKNDSGTRNGAGLEILLVEEMKLALPMRESESGFVSATEVEERVRGLMESEEGKLIRERTVGMKIAAKVASSEGGSSRKMNLGHQKTWILTSVLSTLSAYTVISLSSILSNFKNFRLEWYIGAAMEEAIVLYPSPLTGHLMSMVELGKLLLTHQPSLSIHILITSVPYDSGSTAPYIANVAATVPSIKFHRLPTVTLPYTKTNNLEQIVFEVLSLSNPHVREELLSISKNYTVHGLVVDFFCSAALSVARELNIPAHYYFTSGAGVLAVFLYFPTIHDTTTKSLKDLKTLLHIPGVPPIPSTDMPVPMLERENKAYEYFKDSSSRFPELSGIIVNTFESLESRAVKIASEGLCVPNNRTPPIYCIGPLIATEGPKDDAVTRNGTTLECLEWLDSQPVEEMKLALPMRESESGFVSATEVEERVRGLMESEEGKLIRERTVGMKTAAKVASSEGGSSRVALSKLVESWKDK
ncbi:hypothetical protein SADUNF_Sadunf04G0048400 [Salix dunnii]|uniref:Uncharacterized protein n=1 Tax=Salix dunnii TaxID=1413687 RepID=A0A835N0C6_9ROSI|nr:hypothetical protein SADUNF_Sadunf04G0048400 [Salix dunnii]